MWWNLNEVIVAQNGGLPIDWAALSSTGKVIVEIGFGNGEFLEFLGRSNPDKLVVGVEVSQWCAAKGARRVLAAGLANVRIMHGDARFLLRRCFAPESVEKVYMNFPCPWPKARHAQRRVTVPAFAGLINYLLVPGGSFELGRKKSRAPLRHEIRKKMESYGQRHVAARRTQGRQTRAKAGTRGGMADGMRSGN